MYLVAASVLLNAKKASLYNALRTETVTYRNNIFAKSGLSFNHKDKLKKFPYLLTRGSMERRRGNILWHNAINNSITKHRSNNENPLEVSELVELFNIFARRVLQKVDSVSTARTS